MITTLFSNWEYKFSIISSWQLLSKEDVEEKYIRDFLNCSVIDRNSESIPIDKIMFIYKYGSKTAKKIAVDEKLKIM